MGRRKALAGLGTEADRYPDRVPLRPLHSVRLSQLDELGFGGRGEAKDFATVERLSLGGELPINTNGGLLGEAYIHGMNGITEGVRQVRGTSYNQVDGVEHVLVTSGTGVPTSALILAPS